MYIHARERVKECTLRGNGGRREGVTGSPGLADPQAESDPLHVVDRDWGTLCVYKYKG